MVKDKEESSGGNFGAELEQVLNSVNELQTVSYLELQRKTGLYGAALDDALDRLERLCSVDCVEGQRTFTGPRDAGYNHQFVSGNGYVNVLEVVLPGTLYENKFLGHHFPSVNLGLVTILAPLGGVVGIGKARIRQASDYYSIVLGCAIVC